MHLIMNALEKVTSCAHPDVSKISLLITLVSAGGGAWARSRGGTGVSACLPSLPACRLCLPSLPAYRLCLPGVARMGPTTALIHSSVTLRLHTIHLLSPAST